MTVEARKVAWQGAKVAVTNYAIVEAARYIGVPPWELADHPEWIRPAWQAAKINQGLMEPPPYEDEEDAVVDYSDSRLLLDQRRHQGVGNENRTFQ